MSCLPALVNIGVQKAGTGELQTWLDHAKTEKEKGPAIPPAAAPDIIRSRLYPGRKNREGQSREVQAVWG